MDVPLTKVLEELREDHRNIEALLNLVAIQAERIGAGSEPDYETMQDVMQYMLVYSDAVHHPREDLVYEAMREFDDDMAAGLEGIESDHRQIGQLGNALNRDIQAVIVGTPVRRDQVVKDAVDYVRRLRRHMAWEEEDLFLRADKLAAEHEDARIDLAQFSGTDPVFGTDTQPVFRSLSTKLAGTA